MSNDPTRESEPATPPETVQDLGDGEKRPLSAAAKRALAEAEARRRSAELETRAAEKEIGGRGGADPARYGDWEINGRAIDF